MKLSAKEKTAFGLGAVGKDMVYMLSASYILYYYQDVLGGSAMAMGIILMAARVFDAFNDPIMGVIVAKTRTRWGKFRPWLLVGTLCNAIVLLSLIHIYMEPKERPVAVIYWDVNQLKYVTDTFGHLYGDQLIAKIAGSIRAAVTSEETNAYRYGGDEFLMIIPDGTQEIAEDVIEKWRQVMKPIQKNSEIPVSCLLYTSRCV